MQVLTPYIDSYAFDPRAVGLLAQAYEMSGQHDRLVQLYSVRPAACPTDPKAQVDAALLRIRYGDSEAGMATLEKVAATAAGIDLAGPVLTLADLNKGDIDATPPPPKRS